MKMSWRMKLTIALLAVAALLAGISLYLIVTQARDLAEAREELQQAEARKAEVQSASVYVEDSLPTISDFRKAIAGLCKGAPKEAATVEFCTDWGGFIELLDINLEALTARVLATRSKDYRAMRGHYVKLVRSLQPFPDSPWRSGWMARALEGVAYADYKTGRLESARSLIGRADAFDRRSGAPSAFVGTTALKIACASDVPGKVVHDRFSTLTARLMERIDGARRNPRGTEERDAVYELQRVHDDQELYHQCGAAGLDPEKARQNVA